MKQAGIICIVASTSLLVGCATKQPVFKALEPAPIALESSSQRTVDRPSTVLLEIVPAIKTRTVRWTEPADSVPGDIIEVWSTVNLSTWTLKTNVPALVKFQAATNSATFIELSREFFICRTRRQFGTNVFYSRWNDKT